MSFTEFIPVGTGYDFTGTCKNKNCKLQMVAAMGHNTGTN